MIYFLADETESLVAESALEALFELLDNGAEEVRWCVVLSVRTKCAYIVLVCLRVFVCLYVFVYACVRLCACVCFVCLLVCACD